MATMPTAKDFTVQPGPNGGYTVRGTVECPTGGWAVVLVPDPAATTPTTAAFTVRATKPGGMVTQAITPYAVAQNVTGDVTEVSIRLDNGVTTADGGTRITLPVS